ncbi:MAG: cytochrome c family protein [Chthoniobacterales bacterium]
MKPSPLAKAALLLLAACLVSCGPSSAGKEWASDVTGGGNPQHGKQAIQKYGCIGCHTIDGISSEALVGPPLTRMAGRSYLAGNMQNNAANLVHFIQHPREVHNDTAMPEMGVTESDARDITAYLYQFK